MTKQTIVTIEQKLTGKLQKARMEAFDQLMKIGLDYEQSRDIISKKLDERSHAK